LYVKKDFPKTRRDEERRKYSKVDKRAKYKLVRSHGEEWRRIGCPKRPPLKNWKGREEGEKMERGSRKRSSSAGSEKMERVGSR
jgi:hypothetical protein